MYPRNAAAPERIAVGPVVQISDGAVQASGVSIKVKPHGESAAPGGGTTSYEEGVVGYVPTQAETNYTSFQVIAYKTGCIPAAITVVTSAASVSGKVVPADDSITASVFDESTAFPVKSADTGSTAIARTGADSDTLETLSDQMDVLEAAVGNIATTGAAAYEAASSFTKTTGGTEVNTFANTDTSNAQYHQIPDSAGTLDVYYEYSLRPDEVAVGVAFKGRMMGSGDNAVVQAYHWAGDAWVTLFSLTGTNGTTDVTQSPALVGKYTGTGANVGKVRIRIYGTGLTTANLYVDQCIVAKASTARTVGYANGAIWVKTAGTSGTVPYVNGTADNPCPWADALTINSAMGLGRYTATPGTTITLSAPLVGAVVTGRSYALELGTQDVSKSYFEGTEGLSGTGTCPTGEAIFVDCHLNNVTIGEADFVRCHLMQTITMAQASVPYRYHDCTGVGAGKIVFAAANQAAVVSNASGVLTIAGMVGTNTLWVDGNCDLTLDATNTGGTVYLAGAIRLTNSGSGQTIVDSARWDEGQVIEAVADLPTNAELATALAGADDAVLEAISELHDFDPATDVVARVTLVDTTTTLTNSPDLSIVTDAIDALNDLSSAEVQDAAEAALAAYGAATESDVPSAANVARETARLLKPVMILP